ncbi:DUF389 domain-containing protein [Sphingobium sp. CR2-8]|uniref:DUF389 domain-containing protein n=1 Tax=Sphingobium sp. CR2-8 TaxID=1306534 RepID=UPI002DBD0131|nr:DUF389 domain-containing protein [Sphingobium sp. CR2-8]MEC3909835.1 DUF389 domain-containing protein [Sphingobium sp. CR2-8]
MNVANHDSRGKLHRWWNIWVVGGVDHAAVLNQISEDSGWSGRYLFLILISASLSLLGLLMPSVAVLTGAMLLSPLMMPIIGLGFGIATLDFREIRRAATALGLGSAVAVLLSVLLISLSPVQTITSEIAGRTQPTLFDLLVALLSALAGAYALIRGRGGTVVGVAIAIALMPPLVVVGFGLATWNWTIFSGALLLFITNAVTISLTAALVARVYGFGSHLSPHHTGWQLILFFAALGLLSVPLSAALRQIAFEAVAQRQVRDTVRSRFPANARLSQVEIDHGRTPIRVRAVMLTPGIVPRADALIAADLQTRLGRPIDIHVDQLRTSLDAGATEAAQIARASDAGRQDLGGSRDQATATLGLVAGIEPSAIQVEPGQRNLTATAANLPGLGLAGYQALEARARRALPGWSVMLAPPEQAELPDVRIDQGVVDGKLLDLAAWASARRSRAMAINGGTAAQRRAIADGIVSRGGRAAAGTAGGMIRLGWMAAEASPQYKRQDGQPSPDGPRP